MKILVVDDEKDIQVLFQQRFRKEIRNKLFDFEFAFSGEEAVSIMNNIKKEAVLILSDINMPGMSGLELLKHIKNNFASPPPAPIVMMITAYGDDENRNTANQLGAEEFLTKPLDFKELKNKLNNLNNG